MSISISAAFNATSGTGPFYLYCDGTGTTSTATSRPFHEIRYIWAVTSAPAGVNLSEFYDTGSLPLPKWLSYGPVAGFCLETAGTYTVELEVWDGASRATTSQNITITSSDTTYSGANTICFSTDGDFTGAPSGSTHVTESDFTVACETYLAATKRLLFKRGNSFTCTPWNESFGPTGPWHIGSFGSGEKPGIVAQAGDYSSTAMLCIGKYNSGAYSDGTVYDLNFNGDVQNVAPVWLKGRFDQVLLLRLEGSNCGTLFTVAGQNRATEAHCPRYFGAFDCTTGTSKGGASLKYFAAIYADYATVRGCYGDQTGCGTHSFRILNAFKSCIANNTFIGGDNARHALKMHSAIWNAGVPYDTSEGDSDGGGYAKYNVINFNRCEPTTGAAWAIAMGPQSAVATEDARVDDNLVECNFIPPKSGGIMQYGFYVSGQNNVVRNNVIQIATDNNTDDNKGLCRVHKRNTVQPNPSGNEFYDNTLIYLGTDIGFKMALLEADTTTSTLKNNIAYAPNATSPGLITDNATGTVASNNTTDVTTDPVFASATPTTLKDYILDNSSPYRGSGAALKGFYDALGNSRGVQGEAHDAGALCAKNKQHRFIPA